MADEAQETLLSTEATTTTETTSWFGEESKDVVERCGWKTADDAVKSYREMEIMSSGKVKMPTDKSTPEEVTAFNKQLGCPDSPDGYAIPTVDGAEAFKNEGVEKALADIAHKSGVPKEAFEGIVAGYYEQMVEQLRTGMEDGEAALKQEFGDKYDENIKIAQRLCADCSEEFQELMKTTGLGNNPVMIKEFLSLGRKTLSDSLIKGSQDSGEVDKDYVPQYATSPDMYKFGDSEESAKARAYFTARGHQY